MNHIKQYRLFFENQDNRPIISYDFDGCLHTSVKGLDPHDFLDWESWIPFEPIHIKLKEDAKTHRIVVVTARPPETNDAIWNFIKEYDLPVEDVIATNNMPKYSVLKEMGAVRHYDDNGKMKDGLKALGIEFVQTDPINVTYHLHENVMTSTRFEISFTNPRFFISDNTVEAFVNRLRKLDPELGYDPKLSGKMKDSKVIYVESSKLTHPDIKGEFAGFVQKYDNLQMQVVIPRR